MRYDSQKVKEKIEVCNGERNDGQNKAKYINKMNNGNPIILKEAIVNTKDLQEEGTVVRLIDEKNQFLGKGYYGKQNKGYGWVLTRSEKDQVDGDFFRQKILSAIEKRKYTFKMRKQPLFVSSMGKAMESAASRSIILQAIM